MSYEYGSRGQMQLPNPARVENLFFFATGALLLAAGLWLLFLARGELAAGRFPVPVVLAVVAALALIATGLVYGAKAFGQLRFFFGRERPADLVNSKAGEAGARELAEVLRQQALVYSEPAGPFNGLLYSIIPHLIYSPAIVQFYAQHYFRLMLTFTVLLLTLSLALFLTPADSAVRDWVGWFFLAYGLLHLRSALHTSTVLSRLAGVSRDGSMKITTFVLLLAFAVLGPVLLAMAGSGLPVIADYLAPFPHVYLLLITGLVIFALFFASLMAQTRDPPDTSVSCVQQAWSLHCAPAQLVSELERMQQEMWELGIPNRRYLKREPAVDINQRSGNFAGELMEETQPLPLSQTQISLASAFADRRQRWLVVLNVVGTLLWAVAAISVLLWLSRWLGGTIQPSLAMHGVLFALLGLSAHNAAHLLWHRFDFRSRLLWLELNGQYVSAAMDHGNLLTGQVKTSSTVTKIEGMTYRLWLAEVESVSFGKDAPRQILALRGVPELANSITAKLRKFADEHALTLAPTSSADRERHNVLQQMNAGTPIAAPGVMPALATGVFNAAGVAPETAGASPAAAYAPDTSAHAGHGAMHANTHAASHATTHASTHATATTHATTHASAQTTTAHGNTPGLRSTCLSCQSPIVATQRFCANCGAPVTPA